MSCYLIAAEPMQRQVKARQQQAKLPSWRWRGRELRALRTVHGALLSC